MIRVAQFSNRFWNWFFRGVFTLALTLALTCTLLFVVSVNPVHATGMAAKPVFPTYEEEVNSILALFNQDKLAPGYLRSKFSEVSNTKRRAIYEYDTETRRNLEKSQKTAKDTFDEEIKKETSDWRRENPKGDFRAKYKELAEKRKAFSDKQRDERRSVDQDLRTKRKQYEDFMKIRSDEFYKKLPEYSKAQAAAARGTAPAAKGITPDEAFGVTGNANEEDSQTTVPTSANPTASTNPATSTSPATGMGAPSAGHRSQVMGVGSNVPGVRPGASTVSPSSSDESEFKQIPRGEGIKLAPGSK